ncbi:GNAT family N-acetyltransferase [Selenomonas sputigena]|uniref:GNAT family N-acetyltransferase n=1 Tax=Selenomonas sputigena TaxID=69823 RepID=A0ABV3X7Z3_9FIRM
MVFYIPRGVEISKTAPLPDRRWRTRKKSDYHGQGIAGRLVEMAKEKYKDYLYFEIMPEESKKAAFYEKHGFQIMKDGVAMQICNFANRM